MYGLLNTALKDGLRTEVGVYCSQSAVRGESYIIASFFSLPYSAPLYKDQVVANLTIQHPTSHISNPLHLPTSIHPTHPLPPVAP